jgi:hypothetical protein
MRRARENNAASQEVAGRAAGAVLSAVAPVDRLRAVLGLDTNAGASAEAAALEHRGLPVARLRSPVRDSKTYYVVTTLDRRGRLGDRSPVRILGWNPGHAVAVTLATGAIMVTSRPGAREVVTQQGHLRLRTSVRHACRLQPGGRLLVAAYPDVDILVAYTAEALDQMILAYHSQHGPGNAR